VIPYQDREACKANKLLWWSVEFMKIDRESLTLVVKLRHMGVIIEAGLKFSGISLTIHGHLEWELGYCS
jgi:hypothetical protein